MRRKGAKLRKIKEIAKQISDFLGIDLIKVNYVKEAGNYILRVIISKEEGTSTKDCEQMSRALSKKLDEMDIIEERYFLEVSSPGIDK